MAKRGKRKVTLEEVFQETAGPELVPQLEDGNGKDHSSDGEDAAPIGNVNAQYDAMPNEISDPGAVFKLAFLDAELKRLQVQALMVKQEGETNIRNLQAQYQNTVNTLQAQAREVGYKIKAHRDYIEKRYGISLRSYNYDDETGVLKKQTQTPETAGGKEAVTDGN